jgi:hypothetical protein
MSSSLAAGAHIMCGLTARRFFPVMILSQDLEGIVMKVDLVKKAVIIENRIFKGCHTVWR